MVYGVEKDEAIIGKNIWDMIDSKVPKVRPLIWLLVSASWKRK